jgi:hypothetical protein
MQKGLNRASVEAKGKELSFCIFIIIRTMIIAGSGLWRGITRTF